MPATAITLTATALSCLLTFGVLVTRTGQTERVRGVWLVFVAAGAVLMAAADVAIKAIG